MITSANEILVIRIRNPFDPKDHTRELMAWDEPRPISFFAPVVASDMVISLNGGVVEPEDYGTTLVKAGDCVVTCPILQKGGGGKNVLRVVALVAIAIAAPYAAGAMGFTAGTAAFAAATAGFSIAGSLLVNAILPPVMPTQSFGGSEGSTTEASYGADGPKNVSREGAVVPVVYGKYRVGGNLISSRTELEGQTQYLYLLFALSEGPVSAIGDILVNDTPISKFKNVQYQTRLGSNDQAPIDWFMDNENLVTKAVKLTNDSWVYHTTSSVVDALKLNIVAPTGIGQIDSTTGRTVEHTVTLQAQYRRVGESQWRTFIPNAEFTIEKRQVVPHEVVEVVKKQVDEYGTRTVRKREGGKDGDWYETTVSYKLPVPRISYSKSIVFKSFKYADTGEIVVDPSHIAAIRSAIKAATTPAPAPYAGRPSSDRGDKERNSGRESSDWGSSNDRDYGGFNDASGGILV